MLGGSVLRFDAETKPIFDALITAPTLGSGSVQTAAAAGLFNYTDNSTGLWAMKDYNGQGTVQILLTKLDRQ
jgi:hypothetical protein